MIEGRPVFATSKAPRAVTYRVYRPGPGTIRLWSLQPLEVWIALRQQRILAVDPARSNGLTEEADVFQAPYVWLRTQMMRRVSGYGGGYPWWAYDYKLDLRRERFDPHRTGRRMVRLELAIPAEKVLLSAYGEWHCVLSQRYLPHSTDPKEHERELQVWERELRTHGVTGPCAQWPEPFRAQLEASWERIFDVDDLRETNTIQATFEHLVLAEVVAVTEYTTVERRLGPLTDGT